MESLRALDGVQEHGGQRLSLLKDPILNAICFDVLIFRAADKNQSREIRRQLLVLRLPGFEEQLGRELQSIDRGFGLDWSMLQGRIVSQSFIGDLAKGIANTQA